AASRRCASLPPPNSKKVNPLIVVRSAKTIPTNGHLALVKRNLVPTTSDLPYPEMHGERVYRIREAYDMRPCLESSGEHPNVVFLIRFQQPPSRDTSPAELQPVLPAHIVAVRRVSHVQV